MGQITRVSYDVFVSKTQESLARYESGNANEHDIAQLGYAAERGVDHVIAQHGYGILDTQREYGEYSLMMRISAIVEDSQTDGETTFEGIRPREWSIHNMLYSNYRF
jgi:hypothetical protein